MFELNGQPQVSGGVILGGRTLTITINRDAYTLLSTISKVGGRSQHDLATDILMQGIRMAWSQLCREKLIYVICHPFERWVIAT